MLLTKQGLENLQKELDSLKSERPAAVLDLKKAREMGDLSENGYYKGARMKLSSIDHRIRQLERMLKKVEIIQTRQKEFVEIGHTVVLEHNNEQITFTIVGTAESNPSKGTISHKSPLGNVLLNKRPGETIFLELPAGKHSYFIVKII